MLTSFFLNPPPCLDEPFFVHPTLLTVASFNFNGRPSSPKCAQTMEWGIDRAPGSICYATIPPATHHLPHLIVGTSDEPGHI